ncbi:MAG: efflux RND transporter periplasmic adaptor subunit [Gammaproteobacteria bacterium]|nr:efflux RND transporter periplasmic adaptor subunit [Gammaproteobacteria bacterium]
MSTNSARLARASFAIAAFAVSLAASADEEAGHAEDHAEEEAGFVSLSRHDWPAAGVKVEPAELRRLRTTVVLPAEVVVNGYLSASVTPKIPSVVEVRHVRLGDAVEVGQPLATLSSVAMAEAAGELMLAAYEWRLVQELGQEAVSGRRYAEAETAQRKAMARVLAYGLTERQAQSLSTSDDMRAFSGRFDLLAPRAGTVFSDDFVVGELIEPGRVLVEIVDESSVWVEARAADLSDAERGDAARVVTDDGGRFEGVVVQRHHRLDETTRTRALRIEVENSDDALHPG